MAAGAAGVLRCFRTDTGRGVEGVDSVDKEADVVDNVVLAALVSFSFVGSMSSICTSDRGVSFAFVCLFPDRSDGADFVDRGVPIGVNVDVDALGPQNLDRGVLMGGGLGALGGFRSLLPEREVDDADMA